MAATTIATTAAAKPTMADHVSTLTPDSVNRQVYNRRPNRLVLAARLILVAVRYPLSVTPTRGVVAAFRLFCRSALRGIGSAMRVPGFGWWVFRLPTAAAGRTRGRPVRSHRGMLRISRGGAVDGHGRERFRR